MTPHQRVMTALAGKQPDCIPFTIYENKLPKAALSQALQQHLVCAVKRIRSYTLVQPNVSVHSYEEAGDDGQNVVCTVYSTPHGDLTAKHVPAGFTSWRKEYLFKTAEDYKRIKFLLDDTAVVEDYAAAARAKAEAGEAWVVRDNLPLEPMQSLISSQYMAMETYCMEWMDRRDEVLSLYQSFVELARRVYPVVAAGPLDFANYGGNVVPQIIGREGFRRYYMPHYDEAAEALHQAGKLLGCHLDADNHPIMTDIAETALDYIEAYDPSMSPSVKEARQTLAGKVLWLNWPSAWHRESLEVVRQKTLEMLAEAAPGDGFLVGITEDMPRDRREANFWCIAKAMQDYHS